MLLNNKNLPKHKNRDGRTINRIKKALGDNISLFSEQKKGG